MLVYPVIISLLNTLTTHTLLTRKRSFFYCVVAFILNTLFVLYAVFLTTEHIRNPLISKYTLIFIAFMYIIYNYFVFDESFSKKIFTMFSVWILSLIITFIAFSITQLFAPSIDQKYLPHLAYMFRFLFHIFVILSSKFRLSKPYKKSLTVVSNKIISFMSLYLIVAFLLLIHKTSITYADSKDLSFFYETFLSVLSIVTGYVIVFAGISSSGKTIMLQLHYKIVKNQAELQLQNYKTLNESLNQLYTHKHDVRHHISAIETLVQQQRYPEALEYINHFNQNDLSKTLPTLCENFVADSIIKYYMSLAIRKSIDLDTNLIIPEAIGIDSLDLCVVLGNCLENAIEASEKLNPETKKTIHFMSKLVGTHIVFYISNNFSGEIDKIGNTIKSSKDGRSHGIGLSSVFETVHKYNGNVDIKHIDHLFEITIIMCTSMASEPIA